jgi:hypothetical protein
MKRFAVLYISMATVNNKIRNSNFKITIRDRPIRKSWADGSKEQNLPGGSG